MSAVLVLGTSSHFSVPNSENEKSESGHVFIHWKCAGDHRGQEPTQAEPEALAIGNTLSFYQRPWGKRTILTSV